MDMGKIVCVLGMHRSGTSMLCEILQGLGVFFGKSEMLYEGDEYNRDGYFEIKEIRLVFDKLFSEIHSSWRSTALLGEDIFGKENAARADYYTGWIADCMERCMDVGSGMWGFKEPSASVLLPLVKRAFSFCGKKPVYAVIIRNPLEVAASLKRREGMEEGQALRLYMKYYISILKGTAGEEVVFFQKEEFTAKKSRAFKKLDGRIFSGKLAADGKTEKELEKYIKADYFHADYGEEQVKERGNELLCELYDYLNRLCEAGEEAADRQEERGISEPSGVYGSEKGQDVYRKAEEFERRYEEELEGFALRDAYAEAEYRKEQMKSFAGQISLYRQWLKNKIYGIDCLAELKRRGMKKIGVYGCGEVCSFFLEECIKSDVDVVYFAKGKEEETECPKGIRRVPMPFLEQADAVIIAESMDEAGLKSAERLIGGRLHECGMESEIISLEALLKASYEAEKYRQERRNKKKRRMWDGKNGKAGVLIFKSKSLCYDSTNYFADCLAEAFRKEGYGADILDFEAEGEKGLEDVLEKEYEAVFDFNSNLPQAVMEDGRHYLDCFHAPFFQILLDHPMYLHMTLKEPLKEEYVCCIDQGHAEYVKKYYPHVKDAFLMPVPGIYAGEFESLPPFTERKIDIFLPATYERPEKYEWEIGQAIPDIRDGIWDIVSQMKENPNVSMEEALERMAVRQEMDGLDRKGKATVYHAHFLADMYINAYYREKAVKVLLKNGVRLCVCGQGWEEFDCEGRENLTIFPAVDFKEISGLMQQAKIVLNIAYAFKNGCHDRVLSTMLAGAVSVTSGNPYMEAHFGKDELVFYRMDELEKLPSILLDLLEKGEELESMAEKGYRKAVREYTWEENVKRRFVPVLG